MTDLIDREKLKSFLFFELGDEERQKFEARFFEDNDLFYELIEFENELVDQYVSDDLPEVDKTRFEKSLAKLPERREKVANATALQSFILEENKSTEVVANKEVIEDTPTLWEQITEFFDFKMPMMQFATAALAILIVGGISYIVYDQVQKSNQIAETKKHQEEQRRLQEIEDEQRRLEEQQQKLDEQQKKLENNSSPNRNQNTSEPTNQIDKTKELEKIKQEKIKNKADQKRLDDEEEKIKKDKTIVPSQKKDIPLQPKPIIASILLLPSTGGKGGNDAIKTVKKNTTKVNATLQIPPNFKSETYNVTFNGKTISNATKPKGNTITVEISTKNLTPGNEYRFSVKASNGKRKDYSFRLLN